MNANLNTIKAFSSIPVETVALTMKAYDKNGVAKFLSNEYGEKAVENILKEGDVGTGRDGSILWFQDGSHSYRTGKIITVDEQTGCVLGEDMEFGTREIFKKVRIGV